MNIAGLITGGVLEQVGKIADDLITTDKERMAAALEDKREDNKLLLGQQDINKVEAANASLFVAGWRPYIGWICGTAIGLIYIPKALVMTAIWTYAAVRLVAQWNGVGAMPALPPFPDLGLVDLIALTLNLLGMAALRHRETVLGKARDAVSKPAPGQQEAP